MMISLTDHVEKLAYLDEEVDMDTSTRLISQG